MQGLGKNQGGKNGFLKISKKQGFIKYTAC